MAEVFVSYCSSDRGRVRPLVEALTSAGFTVWWDRDLAGGARFSDEIQQRLDSADCILVAWSEASIESMWVADEATIGRDQHKLVPVLLDPVQPPIGFRQVQTIDFSGWSAQPEAEEFQELAHALGSRSLPSEGAAAPLTSAQGISLIVLPFRTLSTDPADTVLSLAIHEDLTTQIARAKDVFVISRVTAELYADRKVAPSRLARDLGVSYVVEGSVRRAGDSVRVSAQLIDARQESVIAAFRFDRPYNEIIDLQDSLIAEIHNNLGSEINVAEARMIVKRAGTAPTAMEEYRCAKATIHQHGWSRKSVAACIAHLESAIEFDPEFAPAISQLSLSKALAAGSRRVSVTLEEAKPEIIRLANEAVEIDPQSSEVLGLAGCALCDVGEYERGVMHLEHAFDIDPSNAQAHAAYGWGRILQGRAREGVREMSAAIRISPKQPGLSFWLFGLATGLVELGETDAARDRLEKALRFDPRFVPPYFLLADILRESGEEQYANELMARGEKYEAAQLGDA